MPISIIMPAYKEAENIGKLVSYLILLKTESVIEKVVMDAALPIKLLKLSLRR